MLRGEVNSLDNNISNQIKVFSYEILDNIVQTTKYLNAQNKLIEE
jgi:hypothetical protein